LVQPGSDDSGSGPAGDMSDGGPGSSSSMDSGSAGDRAGPVGNPPPGGGSALDSGAPETSTGSLPPPADAGAGADTGAPVTSGDSDGFGASRIACINKINALRATNTAVTLQPYTLQDTSTLDTCVNTQASTDQSMNTAHYSFNNDAPSCKWGSAMGFAQNECAQGYGTTPSAIEHCIQDMWDESLKPNCSGCVGCTAFGGACANCDYSGQLGYECGHYVNLSAPYFTMVACGFAGSAPSSPDGWSVQNFE
jgi:hypothetical protein